MECTCWITETGFIVKCRLCRAAPELYEACKEVLRKNELGSIRLPNVATHILEQAIAAVEKGD